METIIFNIIIRIDNFINYISYKIAKIKEINKLISDISISKYLIYSLLKKYDLYKPLLNSIRANINKLKLELLKADTFTKKKKLRAKPPAFNPDTILKILAI
jgi:hypothetical protein